MQIVKKGELDIFFRQITIFIKVCMAFVFGLDPLLINGFY